MPRQKRGENPFLYAKRVLDMTDEEFELRMQAAYRRLTRLRELKENRARVTVVEVPEVRVRSHVRRAHRRLVITPFRKNWSKPT